MSLVLACDVGGSSVRAGLIDKAGALVRSVSAPSPAAAAEIDPEAWWRALAECAGRLGECSGVAAVAITGVTRTQVLVDADGRALRPALTWLDTRSAAVIAGWSGSPGLDHPELPQLNAFHPLARLLWLEQTEPEILARAACVLDPKDALAARLTGVLASDPISTARLAASADLFGPAARLLPARLAAGTVVGTVRTGLAAPWDALAGRPVMMVGPDTWACALGLGALRHGRAYNLSGTTEVFGVVGARPAFAEGLLSVDWGDGLWQLGGPGQNGGETLAWLREIVGVREVPPPSGPPLLFLPYLQGERTPYWDRRLRGAFVGLDRRHGPGDLARAVMQGTAFLNRIVLERAEAALDFSVDEIRFGGGGAGSPEWARIKATVCGRPVAVCAAEPGLRGAGMTAWRGLGAAMPEPEIIARHAPDPTAKPLLDALFAQFRNAEAALRPISHALAAMDQS